MQGHDIRLKTYQDLMSDQSIISLILYFKSKRVVSTSLYGESRNENFMRVYKAIEELTDPLLLNIIEMNELDSLDLKTACSTECGEEI